MLSASLYWLKSSPVADSLKVDENKALEQGMKEKAEEFKKAGSEVYVAVDA